MYAQLIVSFDVGAIVVETVFTTIASFLWNRSNKFGTEFGILDSHPIYQP